jgi:transcriptional regulator with XRE-family HTH domain
MGPPTQITFAQTLGARIRRQRRSRDLTQAAVAEALGVARQSLSAYEQGRALPPIDKVSALCAVLAITPNELFGEACRPMPLKDDDEKIA